MAENTLSDDTILGTDYDDYGSSGNRNIFRGDFGLFYQTVKSSALLQPYTDVIDTYVFRLLIDSSDYGVSSAAGLYQSILCFVTIMICNGIVKKLQPDYALY